MNIYPINCRNRKTEMKQQIYRSCITLSKCITGSMCFVLLLTHGSKCQSPPPPPPAFANPQWSLEPQEYIATMTTDNSIHSNYRTCKSEFVFRKTYGNDDRRAEAYAIPLHWSSFLSISGTMNSTSAAQTFSEAGGPWPEIILPFIFAILLIVVAIISLVPFFILGCIGAVIIFNLRILGHKRIRMLIRSLLIKMEKNRRWKYERSFPLQHLRKFRERDRYHLPEAFQNSDLESDDEPLELIQESISRQKTTMWAPSEIELLGFDPDNIPMETVYGDLLGNTDQLASEVKRYIRKKRENPDLDVKKFRKDSNDSDEVAAMAGAAAEVAKRKVEDSTVVVDSTLKYDEELHDNKNKEGERRDSDEEDVNAKKHADKKREKRRSSTVAPKGRRRIQTINVGSRAHHQIGVIVQREKIGLKGSSLRRSSRGTLKSNDRSSRKDPGSVLSKVIVQQNPNSLKGNRARRRERKMSGGGKNHRSLDKDEEKDTIP